MKAVVFVRDCGATTHAATQVSILKPAEQLRNSDAGNVFHLEGGGPAGYPTLVTVEWDELDRLFVSYDKNEVVSYAQNYVRDINVFYRLLQYEPK